MDNEKNKNRQGLPNMLPPMPPPPQRRPDMPKGNPYMNSKYMRKETLEEREKRLREEEKLMRERGKNHPPRPLPPQMIRTNLPPMPVVPPAMRHRPIQPPVPQPNMHTKPNAKPNSNPVNTQDVKSDEKKGQIVSAKNFAPAPVPVPMPAPKRHAVKQEQETTLASYENTKNMALFKTVMGILFLYLVSTGMSFVRFKLPFLPSFLEIEFSIVPEFICVVFFGPIVASGMVVLKNLTHMLIYTIIYSSPSYVSELSNVSTDLMFIILAFIVYRIAINNESAEFVSRGKRIQAVSIAGVVSSFLSSMFIVPFDYYLIYPLFIKYFRHYGIELNIMAYYLEKLPNLTAMWQGLLIFNLPWELGKLLVVTLIAVVAYTIATANE